MGAYAWDVIVSVVGGGSGARASVRSRLDPAQPSPSPWPGCVRRREQAAAVLPLTYPRWRTYTLVVLARYNALLRSEERYLLERVRVGGEDDPANVGQAGEKREE